jgi:hypothetical protein
MFSQVGFPTINCHPHPDPVPMFVRYPRHRLQSVPSAAICATGLDLGHAVSSAPPTAIPAMGCNPGHKLASAPSATICAMMRDLRGLSRKRNKADRCDDDKFKREGAQIKRTNSTNL